MGLLTLAHTYASHPHQPNVQATPANQPTNLDQNVGEKPFARHYLGLTAGPWWNEQPGKDQPPPYGKRMANLGPQTMISS